MNQKHRPWIIAHRGARDQAPENTSSALKLAMSYAIDGVEFDVQMSSDGVPVLYHDRTLLKICRRRKAISDHTRQELEKIDWGAWFDPIFSGEPLTTLSDALSLVGDCPNICIEIKSRPADQISGRVYQLTETVVTMLNQPEMKGFKKHALILSFDPKVLARAHEMDADIRYVLNISEEKPENKIYNIHHLWAVDTRIDKLTAPLVQWAHQRQLRVFTFTCNGPRQVKKAARLGADAIITDRPGWLTRQFEHLGM